MLIGTRWTDTPTSFPERVTVIEDAPHSFVLHAWERCLFGVTPSIWPDPLPGVVREGMSRGRPIVASAVGGIVDMVEDGRNGLLVQAGDREGLTTAMTRLVADPDLRERLGTAARISAAPFTSDAVATEFERLYLQLLPNAG